MDTIHDKIIEQMHELKEMGKYPENVGFFRTFRLVWWGLFDIYRFSALLGFMLQMDTKSAWKKAKNLTKEELLLNERI